jgi:acyl-CoA thioesterase-1
LFLGTSLTAGLGVEPDSAYPAVIQRRIDSLGLPWRVINGGVSGETSAGLLRRLPWQLQGPLGIVVVETGANDGLRGLDVDSTRANLDAIIRQVQAHDSTTRIVIVGMQAPPNMGPQFTRRFRELFPELARRDRLALIPFLLTGVAGVDSLNQGDGIHPTPAGHRIVADNVWRVVGPMVTR